MNAIVLTNVSNTEVFVLGGGLFHGTDTGVMREEYKRTWIGAVRPKLALLTEQLQTREVAEENVQ